MLIHEWKLFSLDLLSSYWLTDTQLTQYKWSFSKNTEVAVQFLFPQGILINRRRMSEKLF